MSSNVLHPRSACTASSAGALCPWVPSQRGLPAHNSLTTLRDSGRARPAVVDCRYQPNSDVWKSKPEAVPEEPWQASGRAVVVGAGAAGLVAALGLARFGMAVDV